MNNFFQNAQNRGKILSFDFYLEGKKATVNYCSYEWKHIIMKK